jgi:hypothetical protein
VHDLLLDDGQDLIALGSGIDPQGDSDLHLTRVDPTSTGHTSYHLAGSLSDGPTRLIDLPGAGAFVVVGWRDSLGSRLPFMAAIHNYHQSTWQHTYALSHQVVEVTDAASLGGRLAITGSALDVNGLDTLAFLLITDASGLPLHCHYYRIAGDASARSLALTGLTSSGAALGFLIGGARYRSAQDTLSRSWLMATDLEGLPQWTRTYYRTGSDLPLSEAIYSLTQPASEELFLAQGPFTYHRSDQLPLRLSCSIQGYVTDGQVSTSGDDCSTPLQASAQSETLFLMPGGSWDSTGTGLQPGSLTIVPSETSSNYCAFPSRLGTPTTINTPVAATGPQQVAWYDVQGRLLHEQSLPAGAAPQVPAHLPAGLYVLHRYVQGNLIESRKVMAVRP